MHVPSVTMREALVGQLASEEAGKRLRARVLLVALGKAAVPSLIEALQTSANDHVRWEAVKILGEIGDARAIPALVAALEDRDPDVAWLAADALRQFKRAAWPSLLRRLIRNGSHSVVLRHAAHCVFWHQSAEGCDDQLAALMNALSSLTVPETAAIAAYDVLHRLQEGS